MPQQTLGKWFKFRPEEGRDILYGPDQRRQQNPIHMPERLPLREEAPSLRNRGGDPRHGPEGAVVEEGPIGVEEKLATLTEQTGAADFYNQDFSETEPVLKALDETQQALDTATERWIELEEMQG